MATQLSARPALLERKSTLWCVALLIVVLFSLTNLPWTLDDYDQAKQAFTSYEMVNQGHWLYQHTPSDTIATKPPLVGWVSAVLFGLTRSWELAWRLPSFAAAIALLLVITRTARTAYGTIAGLLAASAFGLNLLSPRLATLVRTDMPLALVTILLGLEVWKKMRRAEPWSTRDRWVMFALLTAAMLIKGPIVYAFLLPGIIAFQFMARRRGDRHSAWPGWRPWLGSLAVFLIWVEGGMAFVPDFYNLVVMREFAARFGETIHHTQPLYFYFTHLLHRFAPWNILIVAFAVVLWRSRRRPRGAASRFNPEITWLLCWSLGGLFVMSLIPSKRVDRIFPIVPPLCMLLAAQFASIDKCGALGLRARRWSAVALVIACLFSGGYVIQKMVAAHRADSGALVRFGQEVRREAAAHSWRYEVIRGPEESPLLYLRRPRFLAPDEVTQLWNDGALDAVVLPAELLAQMLAQLPGSTPSGLEGSITINRQPRRYLLLIRSRS